ncbi:uncharacterized protein LOC119402797 isoform X3 [Rhipicephalus sanguineus]|uniref:uncharacterized protein LOC119402797 isoform X3 n=1 Tax=Rhipicephalus sanguineus TaxID=34632 RepID=UPI0018936C5C|nr:uncharacterized protein LOC119402797 isoform X3 [Rhipicephalus sanguineus]
MDRRPGTRWARTPRSSGICLPPGVLVSLPLESTRYLCQKAERKTNIGCQGQKQKGRCGNKVFVVIQCQEMAQENGEVYYPHLGTSSDKATKKKSIQVQMRLKVAEDALENLKT